MQAGVNLFQMHETTLMRGNLLRGAGGAPAEVQSSFAPQLLSHALQPFGGNGLNLQA